MSRWTVFENRRQHLTLAHQVLGCEEVTPCGEMLADTPPMEILGWISGHAQAGDVVVWPDGQVSYFLLQLGLA